MLYNKKGLSGIISIVIMIGLVLVAVGIVWVMASGILEGQAESLDQGQVCLGLIFGVSSPVCEGGQTGNCTVNVERTIGSKGDSIDGIEVTWMEGDQTSTWNVPGTVAASKVIRENLTYNADKASIRIYFEVEGEDPFYCSQIFSSE